MTMPFMICLMLATGVAIGASTGAAVRIVRAPAMMKPIPLMNSATLTTKSQCTVRIVVALSHVRAPRRDAHRDDLHDRHDHGPLPRCVSDQHFYTLPHVDAPEVW